MIFSPDIKPPMWGPPDAVQYAVRHNAERMGIDNRRIVGLFPVWEFAGLAHDLISTIQGEDYGTIEWGAKSGITGKIYNSNADCSAFERSYIGSGAFTAFAIAYTSDHTSRRRVIRFNSDEYGTVAAIEFYLDKISGVIQRSSGTFDQTTTGPLVYSNVPYTLSQTWEPNVRQKIGVNGDIYPSQISPYSFRLPSDDRVYFGNNSPGGTYSLNGLFSFAAIFDTALTDNQIISLHATPYALLMPVSRPVYFDLGATSGGTLTTESAWKIYTAAEIDTAWRIRAALSQSAAWAVFTRDDTASAWSIRTSAEAETAWTVRADLETETAWPIATAADTPTEWQIKAGVDMETAWPIFTAVDTATAWAILDSLALETPTAWSIRNALAADAAWSIRTALDTGSAWAILSRLDRETAWQILGAGILDTPTAWAIRADLDQATAWTIKTSLAADTDWTIVNGMDTATAWDILQGFATDTDWQVFHGLDTATAWSIISDTVPEPVRVFMAESRDFIINAEKRIFILLAERK